MKKAWKRNAVVAGVLVLVCTAIFLNGRYAKDVEETDKILGQSTLVNHPEEVEAVPTVEPEYGEQIVSDYFATARLTRQQARDSALSLLQEAEDTEGLDAERVAQTAEKIQTLAGYTLSEAQIENMVTAKGYADCVVFLSADSVSVVVSALEDGLKTEDVAKITDIVKQETGLRADQIKILEVN